MPSIFICQRFEVAHRRKTLLRRQTTCQLGKRCT